MLLCYAQSCTPFRSPFTCSAPPNLLLHQWLSLHMLVHVLTLYHSFPRRAELLAMAPALENGYVRVPKTGIGADAIGEE